MLACTSKEYAHHQSEEHSTTHSVHAIKIVNLIGRKPGMRRNENGFEYYLYAVKRYFFRVAILGMSMFSGWVLGYLRFPHLEKDHAFLLGFAACAILLLLAKLLRPVFRRTAKKDHKEHVSNTRPESRPTLFTAILTIVTLSLLIILIYRNLALEATLKGEREDQIRKFNAVTESLRNSRNVELMAGLLLEVEKYSAINPNIPIPESLIERLASLSQTLKPYRTLGPDDDSVRTLSPERGRLLVTLMRMPLDSLSAMRIRQACTFVRSDLRDLDLSGLDLSHVNLREADLSFTRLSRSKLDGADLSKAALKGIDLRGSSVQRTSFVHADLKHALLDSADLTGANLNGAHLENAQLRNANLHNASIQWAFLNGVVSVGSNYKAADLTRSELKNGNFQYACFDSANIYRVLLHNSDLRNVRLHDAKVQEIWFEDLDIAVPKGIQDIKNSYRIETDSNSRKFFLVLKGDQISR